MARSKPFRRGLVVASALVLGLTLAAPAEATTEPAGGQAPSEVGIQCTGWPGTPTSLDYTVYSTAYNGCTAWTWVDTKLKLQRHRWYGWQELDSQWISAGDYGTVTWNCQGAGTYTYRAVHTVVNPHTGTVHNKTSNENRFHC